jgi:hypothetical protein
MLLNKTQKALVGVAIAQTPQDFSIIRDPDYAAVLCQKADVPQVRWHGSHHWARRVCQEHALSCPQIGFRAPWFKSVTCHGCGFVRNATPLSRMHSSFLMRLCML